MPLGHDPERRTSGYPSPAPSTYLQTHPIAISGTSAVNNLNFDSGCVTCEVSSRLYAWRVRAGSIQTQSLLLERTQQWSCQLLVPTPPSLCQYIAFSFLLLSRLGFFSIPSLLFHAHTNTHTPKRNAHTQSLTRAHTRREAYTSYDGNRHCWATENSKQLKSGTLSQRSAMPFGHLIILLWRTIIS